MSDILILNVPTDIASGLMSAAKRHGRTIEAEALELIRRGVMATFTPDERLARARHYLNQGCGPFDPLSKEQLREGLE